MNLQTQIENESKKSGGWVPAPYVACFEFSDATEGELELRIKQFEDKYPHFTANIHPNNPKAIIVNEKII